MPSCTSSLYTDLQHLATEANADLITLLSQWVAQTRQRWGWRRGWQELQTLIEEEGGLQVDTTKEAVVDQMRQTRQEIFEAEYAHLYS